MTDYLELAWTGSAEALARALERLEGALRAAARWESGTGTQPEGQEKELLSGSGGRSAPEAHSILEAYSALKTRSILEAHSAPDAYSALEAFSGMEAPGGAAEEGWTAPAVQPEPPWEEERRLYSRTEGTAGDEGTEDSGLPLLEEARRSEALWEAMDRGGLGQAGELGPAAAGGQRSFWSGEETGRRSRPSEELTGLWPGLNRGAEAAEGDAPPLFPAGRRGGETESFAQAERVDLAFRRDSRRYDGGFFLY